MIDAKDIYSGKVESGRSFTVTATGESVFVTDFVTLSVDGKVMDALTEDGRVFSISEIDYVQG